MRQFMLSATCECWDWIDELFYSCSYMRVLIVHKIGSKYFIIRKLRNNICLIFSLRSRKTSVDVSSIHLILNLQRSSFCKLWKIFFSVPETVRVRCVFFCSEDWIKVGETSTLKYVILIPFTLRRGDWTKHYFSK